MFPQVLERTVDGPELAACVADLLVASSNQGRLEGFEEGYALAKTGRPAEDFSLHGQDVRAEYDAKMDEFDNLTYPIVEQINELANQEDGVKVLRAAFESATEQDVGEPSDVVQDPPQL